MTTCLGDSCSFGLPSMFFVNVYQVVLSFFFFFFEGGMLDFFV